MRRSFGRATGVEFHVDMRPGEPNRVRLQQYGRWKFGPDAHVESVFSEAFLRAVDCPYETDSRLSTFGGDQGKVLVNGKAMGQGIEHVEKLQEVLGVNLDKRLNEKELETSSQMLAKLNGSVRNAIVCSRWLREPHKARKYLLGAFWPFSWFAQMYRSAKLKFKVMSQSTGPGMDRLVEKAVRDLGNVSQQLGRKKYMFGDEIHTLDVAIFACVSLLIWDPFDYRGIKSHFIGENSQLSNLTRHAIRMRQTLFPDWEELCKI